MSDKLTGKQARFVDEYIVCLNGTESARRAGYSGDTSALAVEASRLLRNAKVTRALDERLKEFAMPASEVLTRLTDIARGDMADGFNSVGGIDPLEAVKRGKSHLIKRIKTKTTYVSGKTEEDDDQEIHEVEIELYDALDALKTLAKYHDLTNRSTVKIEDWQSQAISDIRAGRIDYEALVEAFDLDLATELFRRAGVPITSE